MIGWGFVFDLFRKMKEQENMYEPRAGLAFCDWLIGHTVDP